MYALLAATIGFAEPSTPTGAEAWKTDDAHWAPLAVGEVGEPRRGDSAAQVRDANWIATPAPIVWGIVGFKIYPYGERTGPNGSEFAQLFSLDFNFNIWLSREHKVYAFGESSFWGQKPGLGITNAHQGNFDFSKREFDFNVGVAWNYAGPWEARVFGYSANNLNRGLSATSPAGYNDGLGIENRYYIGKTYADLGTAQFDLAKATFLSVGYYPSKEMTDTEGLLFKPGPFVRAYVIYDRISFWGSYLFADLSLLGTKSWSLELFHSNVGLAARPFETMPRFELRTGVDNLIDIPRGDTQTSIYLEFRYIY